VIEVAKPLGMEVDHLIRTVERAHVIAGVRSAAPHSVLAWRCWSCCSHVSASYAISYDVIL
jgi:hypothetical protein